MGFLDMLSAGIDLMADTIEETEMFKNEAMQLELETLFKKFDGLNPLEDAFLGYSRAVEKRLTELSFNELYHWWIEYEDYKSSHSLTKIIGEIERRNCGDKILARDYYLACGDDDKVIQDRILELFHEAENKTCSWGVLSSFSSFIFEEKMPYLDKVSKKYKIKLLVLFGIICVIAGIGVATYYKIIPLKPEKPYIVVWIICLIVLTLSLILNAIENVLVIITQMKYVAIMNLMHCKLNKEPENEENEEGVTG